MANDVQDQVERILDEAGSGRVSVIVQMKSKQAEYLPQYAQVLRRRNLASSARDILPTERPKKTKRRSKAKKSRGKGSAKKKAVTPAQLRKQALAQLKPLMSSKLVRAIAAKEKARASKSGSSKKQKSVRPTSASSSAVALWSSASAVLELERDNLSRLLSEVPGIGGVYPNRTLAAPPTMVANRLPQAVLDNKTSSWGLHAVGALAAWGAYGTRGAGITIGLLDTGVDAQHPDLLGKIAHWAEFDQHGNAVVGSTPHDSGQHGTHCAGTIVGGDTSGQWIGVAPEANLAAALVLKAGEGTDAQILAGLDWAITLGVDVISMSLGGLALTPDVPPTYSRAILNALRVGIPVVAAIGNEGSQTSGLPASDYFAFSVGATDYRDIAAGFSGGRTQIIRQSPYFSPRDLPLPYSKPEICAPGVAVRSSTPGGKWEAWNGTSMATPHVAGAVALLLEATSLRSAPIAERAFHIRDFLMGSVEELGEAGQDHRYGFGRLDVLRAIGMARSEGYTP